MFDSFASYVLMAVAAVTLLAAILWPRKRKFGVKGGGTTKEVEVVTDVPEAVLAVEEVPMSKKRVKRMGVLTIDTTDMQICEKCRSVWLGELIRSGKCGKCGGRLLVLVAEGARPNTSSCPRSVLIGSARSCGSARSSARSIVTIASAHETNPVGSIISNGKAERLNGASR